MGREVNLIVCPLRRRLRVVPNIVKYIRLESYDDALDSIDFGQSSEQLPLAELGNEYLLKYMLHWESKDSEALLNASKLVSPVLLPVAGSMLAARKRERTVDVMETFNYLLGLRVKRREMYEDNGNLYLVYRGETREVPDRSVSVIWRETKDWTDKEFARDRDFVAQYGLAADALTVYVNGDSAISRAKPIEPIFKAWMFSSVNE